MRKIGELSSLLLVERGNYCIMEKGRLGVTANSGSHVQSDSCNKKVQRSRFHLCCNMSLQLWII